MKNVPSKKRWQPPADFDSILHVVAKDNNILELQGLFLLTNLQQKLHVHVNIYIQLT